MSGGAPLRIRDATPADVETIVDFNCRLAEETEGLVLDRATVTRGARAVFEDPSLGLYIVADAGGRVVGQLLLTWEWSDWRNGRFWWIQSVYVDKAWRQRGIFKSLYRRAEDLSRAPGSCGLRLYVHEHNRAAQETYRRLGFVAPGYVVLETPDRLRRET